MRKAKLASILRKSRPGVRLNEHIEHPEGAVVFAHACKMGLEGIVSKRLGSRYRSGRSPDWLTFKNPEAPAVRRELGSDSGGLPVTKLGAALYRTDRGIEEAIPVLKARHLRWALSCHDVFERFLAQCCASAPNVPSGSFRPNFSDARLIRSSP